MACREEKKKVCTCVTDLMVLDHVAMTADSWAMELVGTFSDGCPQMMDLIVAETIARFIHVQAVHRLGPDNDETQEMFIEAEKIAKKHADNIVSIISNIIQQDKAKNHASH